MASKSDIATMPINKLIPYSRNPRKNDGVVSQMVASIKEFGFKIPVLAKSDGTVIDGHLRLKAAHEIGMKDVPVILCDEWTDAQVKAFRIMVNKSVSWAEWDEELLKLEFDDLKALDFNLELTGFDLGEIVAQDAVDSGPCQLIGFEGGGKSAGSSPWDRMPSGKADGIMFTFGSIHIRMPQSDYDAFARICPADHIQEFISGMIHDFIVRLGD